VALDEKLTPEQRSNLLRDTPISPGMLTPAEIKTEFETARTGERRSKGRPAKPQNSNDVVVKLLRAHRASDFVGRFTLARAVKTQAWLEKRGTFKSIEAVTKLINREKKPRK
jgi:hypothetical protein